MKIANHYDKQLTPSESWDQDVFFEPGFGLTSNSNHRARICTTPWHSNQVEYLDRLVYTVYSLYIHVTVCRLTTLYTMYSIKKVHIVQTADCRLHTAHKIMQIAN